MRGYATIRTCERSGERLRAYRSRPTGRRRTAAATSGGAWATSIALSARREPWPTSPAPRPSPGSTGWTRGRSAYENGGNGFEPVVGWVIAQPADSVPGGAEDSAPSDLALLIEGSVEASAARDRRHVHFGPHATPSASCQGIQGLPAHSGGPVPSALPPNWQYSLRRRQSQALGPSALCRDPIVVFADGRLSG